MNKYLYLVIDLIASFFTSCSNDDITIGTAYTVNVNASTVISSFIAISDGEFEAFQDSKERLRIRVLIYNENGELVAQDAGIYTNYNVQLKSTNKLKAGKYTVIGISDVVLVNGNNIETDPKEEGEPAPGEEAPAPRSQADGSQRPRWQPIPAPQIAERDEVAAFIESVIHEVNEEIKSVQNSKARVAKTLNNIKNAQVQAMDTKAHENKSQDPGQRVMLAGSRNNLQVMVFKEIDDGLYKLNKKLTKKLKELPKAKMAHERLLIINDVEWSQQELGRLKDLHAKKMADVTVDGNGQTQFEKDLKAITDVKLKPANEVFNGNEKRHWWNRNKGKNEITTEKIKKQMMLETPADYSHLPLHQNLQMNPQMNQQLQLQRQRQRQQLIQMLIPVPMPQKVFRR